MNKVIISLFFIFCIFNPQLMMAHSSSKAEWELSLDEYLKLKAKYLTTISRLEILISEHLSAAEPLAISPRSYKYGKSEAQVYIAQSFLSQAISQAIDLEVTKMQFKLFCGTQCSTKSLLPQIHPTNEDELRAWVSKLSKPDRSFIKKIGNKFHPIFEIYCSRCLNQFGSDHF